MNEVNKFRGKYHFLSNFFNADIIFEGIPYLNNEAAFQAQKVLTPELRKQFSHLNPSIAKLKGRKVTLRDDWEFVKDRLMYEICLTKFTQNQWLKELLLNTGASILIEGNSWNDTYWGICKGKGENKLGKILMQIRERLNS